MSGFARRLQRTKAQSTAPPSEVTHGIDITMANTGFLAYVGPGNQTYTQASLYVYTTAVNASQVISEGHTTGAWFQQGITINTPITLTACKLPRIYNTTSNTVTLNYCTIEPSSPADWSLGYTRFSATRCQIMGSSDGVRYGGSSTDTLIENYIRVKTQGSDDHNDGIQMYGATGGGVMLRNNVDARPVDGGGGANGALFIADGATGTYEIRDNYLLGGGYTLRLHENGYYRVTGNIIEKNSYSFGPTRTDNARPGAFLEWSNNRLSDGTVLNN